MKINITFPNGNKKEFDSGISTIEVAKALSNSLAKEVIAAEVNGKMVDLASKITTDSTIEFYKFEDKKGKEVFWHSSAHIMAQAVKNLFPAVKVTIGPAIEEGFYYDFDREPFTEEELKSIEKEMSKIVAKNLQFERKELPKEEALKFFGEQQEPYKIELIEALPAGEIISCYTQGDFTDLCRGPHVAGTAKIKHFKLLTTSGAYWRGDSTKKMLQRIYGISFPSKEELELFLKRREEAEKRDHRKLGKVLDLFSFHHEAPGMPFFHKNGMIIWNELMSYWREEHAACDYEETKTPIMLNRDLWETSGHWFNYKENMYTLKVDEQDYAVKPMNCPGGIILFKESLHSYRDLPIRAGELGLVHRHELSGALSGLFRVRAFHQDDAHIFMRHDQIKDEIIGVLNLIDKMYSTFGFSYHLELSTRPEQSIGTDEAWELATKGLREALDVSGKGYKINEGDGAFYGPKIDVKVKDALNREWQCGTIQLDMNLPERFDISYIDHNSQKQRPVMIHRVIYGSIERFIGILIEHFGGNFPVWLAPVQVGIIPVSDKFNDFAYEVKAKLQKQGLRVRLDDRAEKVGYKIREFDAVRKTPYMLVIGEKEVTTNNFTVRRHGKTEAPEMDLLQFIEQIKKEIADKTLPDMSL